MRALIGTAAALVLLGCAQDKPYFLDNKNLGVRAQFPAEPKRGIYLDDTPFGRMEWTSFTVSPGGRLDTYFRLEVGNLPPGEQGGATVPQALDSFAGYLSFRMGGPVKRTELPESQGPGFRYVGPARRQGHTEGIAVLRRGRLHHVQATVARAGDLNLEQFLGSFAVD